MDFYSLAPIAVALAGASTFVTALTDWLSPIAGTSSAAAAVVLVTVLVRSLLIPVGLSQVKAGLQRRRLAPMITELRRRYGRDPALLQRKTMELYSAEKVSPVAGCLPSLAQAPVLTIVYGLFILDEVGGHANGLLTERLFGVPLDTSFAQVLLAGASWSSALVFVALLTSVATVAWLSRQVSIAQGMLEDAPPASIGTIRALSWLPFTTVVFAAVVPLAATIYLATTTAWTLAERVILRRILLR